MSEGKSEETPAVVEAPKPEGAPAPVEAPIPVVEEPAAVAATEAAPEVKEEVKEEPKAETTKVEAITEGWLEFKSHGLIPFISNKRFFYLGDEPVDVENLQNYLKKEKKERPEAAHSAVAYASQTGKGLLFFAKTTQKAHPIGIIKLADVVEVVPTGTNKFVLRCTDDVWNFESHSTTDRDSWVHTIKAKAAEAKEGFEAITSSEGYKTTLEKLSKKNVAAAAKGDEEKKKEESEEKEEKNEEKKDEEKEEKKEKKDKKKEKRKEEGAKSDDSSDHSSSEDEGSSDKKGKKKRSNSVKAKRTSFFGILGHKDKKEEETKTEEPKAEVVAEASTEAPVVAATQEERPAEEIKPVEETAKVVESPAATEEVATPKGDKRRSFFGFFDKKKEAEKKEVETIKERDAVSDTPPIIAPIGEEPKEVVASGAKPVDPAVSAPVVEAGTKTPSSPPKESLFDKFALFKSKDKTLVAAPAPEGEVKKEEVAVTKPEGTETVKEGEAVKESEEVAVEASPPQDAKRRSSFFYLGKRDKKPADVKSDTEEEPSTSKSNPTSPIPKKLSLFRKNSKSAKDAPKVEPEEAPPVPEVAPAVVEPQVAATTEVPAPVEEAPVVAETATTTTPATTA